MATVRPAPGRVAGNCHAVGADPQGEQVTVGVARIVHCGGKRVLGGQPVVEHGNRASGGQGEPAAEPAVAVERPDAVSPAMEIEHRRVARPRLRCEPLSGTAAQVIVSTDTPPWVGTTRHLGYGAPLLGDGLGCPGRTRPGSRRSRRPPDDSSVPRNSARRFGHGFALLRSTSIGQPRCRSATGMALAPIPTVDPTDRGTLPHPPPDVGKSRPRPAFPPGRFNFDQVRADTTTWWEGSHRDYRLVEGRRRCRDDGCTAAGSVRRLAAIGGDGPDRRAGPPQPVHPAPDRWPLTTSG